MPVPFDDSSYRRAAFNAFCPLCSTRVRKGDLICPPYGGGKWAHYTCAFEINHGRPPKPPRREKEENHDKAE